MNFQLASFSSFFEPNVEQIKSYNSFLAQQLQIMSNFQLAQTLLNPSTNNQGHKMARILDDSPASSSKAAIYRVGLGPKVDLFQYTVDFQVSGISLLDDGNNSLITDTMNNYIKTLNQLGRDNSNVNLASTLSGTDLQILNSVQRRNLQDGGERNLLLTGNQVVLKVVFGFLAFLAHFV